MDLERARDRLQNPDARYDALVSAWRTHGADLRRAERLATKEYLPDLLGEPEAFTDSDEQVRYLRQFLPESRAVTSAPVASDESTRETAPAVVETPATPKSTRRTPTRPARRVREPANGSRPKGPRVTSWVECQRLTKVANTDPTLTLTDRFVLSEIIAHAGPTRGPDRAVRRGSAWESWPGQTSMGRALGMRPTNVGRSVRRLERAGYLSYVWRYRAKNVRARTNLYGLHLPTLGPEGRSRERWRR